MKNDLLLLNEAHEGLFKIADDTRITRVGHWLRATHLDELLQLFSVRRGEMSFVGPRPLVAEEDIEIAGGDRIRLSLAPGITGQWQACEPTTPRAEGNLMLFSRDATIEKRPPGENQGTGPLETSCGEPASEIMGLGVHPLDEAGTVESVFAAIAARSGGWLVTPNLDILRQIRASAEVRDLVADASLVVADGMPLVWAAALAGRPLPARVPGSTLIYALSEEASRRNASVFLLGGAAGAAEGAADVLSLRFPGLQVAGTYCPPFGFENDENEIDRIAEMVVRAEPDLVFVGLGFPKQERLVSTLRRVAPRTYFLGVGVTFSFVSGEVSRAPRWLQRLGLEWVHRLVQEPRRLFKRYVVDDVPFAVRLFSWAATVRLRSFSGV